MSMVQSSPFILSQLTSDPSSSEMEYLQNKMKMELTSGVIVPEEDRHKKRQVRLEKNRKSAALSRHRKKEYISNLEGKAQELRNSTQEIQLTFSQLSNRQMETIGHLERLELSLSKVLNENDILKKKIAQLTDNNRNSIQQQQQQQQQEKKKEDREIIIGVNKFSHLYNSNNSSNSSINKVVSKYNSDSIEKDEEATITNSNSNNNNNNNNNNIFNNLSYSNPNVNSSPIYLTRARSSSYHPTSETSLIAEALSNLTNTLGQQSPPCNNNINNNSHNNISNTHQTSETSSPILPSLSILTKNLVGCHSPSPSSLSSISSPLLSLSPIHSPNINNRGPHLKKNSLLANLNHPTTTQY